MTQDILREDGIAVDTEGFDACMAEQRQRGRDARRAGAEVLTSHGAYTSRHVGDRVYDWQAPIAALISDGGEQDEVREGEAGTGDRRRDSFLRRIRRPDRRPRPDRNRQRRADSKSPTRKDRVPS